MKQQAFPAGEINWVRIRNISLIVVISMAALCYTCGAFLIHDQGFANQVLLCPNFYNDIFDITIPGVKRRALVIPTTDGQTLDAWLFTVTGAKKLVIVNHGNAGNLTSRGFVAKALTDAKTNVLLYDYRGYGKSTGQASVRGLLEDGQTVYDYARNILHLPAAQIIEYGESMGTAVACAVAADNGCGALMLFASLDSLPSAGKWSLPLLNIYPDFCFAEQLNNTALVRKIHAPVFICHGEIDATLRPQGSQALFDAANQPKTFVLLPDSGHAEMSESDGHLFVDSIARFIASLP